MGLTCPVCSLLEAFSGKGSQQLVLSSTDVLELTIPEHFMFSLDVIHEVRYIAHTVWGFALVVEIVICFGFLFWFSNALAILQMATIITGLLHGTIEMQSALDRSPGGSKLPACKMQNMTGTAVEVWAKLADGTMTTPRTIGGPQLIFLSRMVEDSCCSCC